MTVQKQNIVIIGGGFGGLYAAKKLGGIREIEVTLVDKRNFHLFQPLLYQVATGGLSPGDISSPLRSVFSRYKNIRVIMDEMIDLDPHKNEVHLKNGNLKYDKLIIATGSTHSYFGNPQWENQAPGLKTIEDALEMRRRIFSAFEKAEIEANLHVRKNLTTFVVIGAGPTGVELAGALGELINKTLREDFRSINTADCTILLMEAGPRVLSGYPSKLSDNAVKHLNKLGVKIITNAMVKEITPEEIVYEKDNTKVTIGTNTVLWAAGIKATPVSEALKKCCAADTDRSGKIRVKGDLTLERFADIHIIGDLALLLDKDGKPLPGVSPVAMQQGNYVAQSILRKLKGNRIKPFRYTDKGKLAVIGRNAAVADFYFMQLSGFSAWIIWIFVHIRYLIEYDNKLLVMIQWAWNYFTKKRGARLITRKWKPE